MQGGVVLRIAKGQLAGAYLEVCNSTLMGCRLHLDHSSQVCVKDLPPVITHSPGHASQQLHERLLQDMSGGGQLVQASNASKCQKLQGRQVLYTTFQPAYNDH